MTAIVINNILASSSLLLGKPNAVLTFTIRCFCCLLDHESDLPVTITVTSQLSSQATPNLVASPVVSGPSGLVPDIGFPPGNPAATTDRLGADGKTNIPGPCPPPQSELNSLLLSIHPETFASEFPKVDLESRIIRFEQTLSGLQELKCPAASTTLKSRLLQLTGLRSLSKPEVDAKLAGLGVNEVPA